MIEPDTSLFYFDEKAADKVIAFITRHLVYPASGPGFEVGQPFKLAAWQIPHLRYIFGWKRKDDNSRMVRETFWFLPKKNGKTSIGAIIALSMLFLDEEPAQNIISIATSKTQASICFDMARNMILQSPTLGEMVREKKIIILKQSIEIPSTRSNYKVVSSSIRSIHGPSLNGILFDELHALNGRELYDAVQGAGRSRKSPLKCYMTTAGHDRTSVCYEVYEYSKKINAGIIANPQFYPVLFEPDEQADWKLESTWRKANPNFDLMNKVEWDNEFRQAAEMPASENKFKRLNLNIWTNQSTRWMPFEIWSKNHSDISFAEMVEKCKGMKAYAGLDLAPVQDTSSLVLAIPTDDGKFIILCWVWIPTDNADMRERKDRVPYSTWIRERFVRTTPGETTDYDIIYEQIKAILESFNVVEVGFDNAYIGPIAQWLMNDGFNAIQISQGYESISPAVAEVERLAKAQRLIVPKHPALDWMVGNAEAKDDGGGRRRIIKASYINRVDAVSAMIMAIHRGRIELGEDGPSVYETQGILVI